MVFEPDDIELFKQQCLQWANGFDVCCYLDSNNFKDDYSRFDAMIAAGVKDEALAKAGSGFDCLQKLRQRQSGWLTGFLSYDLKNETELLTSSNIDNLWFPDLYFFAPEHVITIRDGLVNIVSDQASQIYYNIQQEQLLTNAPVPTPDINLQARFTRNDYKNIFEQIKQHIARGDIYVTNFCQEFFAEHAQIDPLATFRALNRISPNPFACYFKHHKQFILCASPERFLAKRGRQVISQPIKGTARRGNSPQDDEHIKLKLRHNTKEQQENVMIVDLVRNDLTQAATPGTVKVSELFGIHSFEHLHQMVSTVTCELAAHKSALDVIKSTFPMGSMTGAPKLSAMKLMERFERTRRGVYSGAIGYFTPDGDFDLNVVIRTLLYNAGNNYLSFQVGSAITFHAIAEQEYDECLLKAKAILQALNIK